MNDVERLQELIDQSRVARELRLSASVSYVASLQTLLFEMGFAAALSREEFVSGEYDLPTKDAVLEFARKNSPKKAPKGLDGSVVNSPLAMRLLARYELLEHLRRLAADLEKKKGALETVYKKGATDPGRGNARQGPITSLQHLLVEFFPKRTKFSGRKLTVDGVYGPITEGAVRTLSGTGDGDALRPAAAKRLIDELGRRYGEHWRDPGGKTPPAPRERPLPPKPTKPTKPPASGGGGGSGAGSDSSSQDLHAETAGVTACLLDVNPVGQQLENWCWAASTQMMLGYLRSLGETDCPTCGRGGHHEEDIAQGLQMNRRLGDSDVDCSVARTDEFDYKTCDRGGWPHFFEFEDAIQSTEWGGKRHVLEEHGLVLRDGGPRLRVRRHLTDWQLRRLTFGSGREFFRRLDDAEGCALSWEMLTGLLDHQRPVAFTYRYPHPGSGHMRLAAGYAVTPGGRRWVAVADPLPPGQGEIHLIPYDDYVDGPRGGHWRDYWVLPDEEASPAKLRRESHELRVGKELVASYIEYDKDWLLPKPPTDGLKLSESDLRAVLAEAAVGLRAIEAIAAHAPKLALSMMMGSPLTEAMLGLFGGAGEPELGFPPVKPGDLEIAEGGLLPVYELSAKELREWQPPFKGDDADAGGGAGEILSLLNRPREVIVKVTRPEQTPFPFFATVTLRRKGDRWKVASLGRAYLMTALMVREFMDAFLGGAFSDSAVSYERMMKFLFFASDLEDETGSGPSEDEIEEALKEGRAVDEKLRQDRRAARRRELAALENELRGSGGRYPAELWNARYDMGPEKSRIEGMEESATWLAGLLDRLRDEELRKEFCELSRAAAEDKGTLDPRLLELLEVQATKNNEALRVLLDNLADLLEGEEEILRLWREWSRTSGGETAERRKRLEALFDASRDQEIAWRTLCWKKLTRDRRRLVELSTARKLDATLDGATGSPQPRYLLSVPELYQLLIGCSRKEGPVEPGLRDQLEPAYEKSFHRPERRVAAGSLLDVLKDLKEVAHRREVLRGG